VTSDSLTGAGHTETHSSLLQDVQPRDKISAYGELLVQLAEARQHTLDAYAPESRSSATYKARDRVRTALTASSVSFCLCLRARGGRALWGHDRERASLLLYVGIPRAPAEVGSVTSLQALLFHDSAPSTLFGQWRAAPLLSVSPCMPNNASMFCCNLSMTVDC